MLLPRLSSTLGIPSCPLDASRIDCSSTFMASTALPVSEYTNSILSSVNIVVLFLLLNFGNWHPVGHIRDVPCLVLIIVVRDKGVLLAASEIAHKHLVR